MNALKRAFSRYWKHCDAIREAETERQYAHAQAVKCRSRGDDKGYGKELAQIRKHTLAALKESNAAGIRGCAAYAGGISSANLIGRMK